MTKDDTIVVIHTEKKRRRPMPICPECLSREMVRFGTYQDKQRWRCKKCGLTTMYPRQRMPIKRKPRRRPSK